MTEAIGGGRKLLGDAGINRGIITSIRTNGSCPQQMWQEFAVGDVLNLAGNDCTRHLVKLVPSPLGMLLLELADPVVVFADEQSIDGCQIGILGRTHVAT